MFRTELCGRLSQSPGKAALGVVFFSFFLNLLAGAVVISRLQQVGNKWYFVYLLSVELLLRASPGCIAHPNSLSFTEQRQNLSELVTLF